MADDFDPHSLPGKAGRPSPGKRRCILLVMEKNRVPWSSSQATKHFKASDSRASELRHRLAHGGIEEYDVCSTSCRVKRDTVFDNRQSPPHI